MVTRWIHTTIGYLIQQKEVSIQTGPFGTILSAKDFSDYGIPVISVREIRQGHIEIFDETPCVSMDIYRRLSQFDLKSNDLVFARKGNVERSALIPEIGQFFLGSDGIRLRFSNPILARLVLYILQENKVKQFLTSNSYGTTMAGLNESIISAIPLFYPATIDEQRRIAEALSDVDELITSLEKLIAKKKAIKQGAMQELLTGKRRLPGFSGEWETKCIRDLGRFVGGGTPSTKNEAWWDGSIPWISSSDLEVGEIRKIQIKRFITQEAVNCSATCICPANTVLIVSRVGVGKVGVAPCALCTSQDFSNLILYDVNPLFVAFSLSVIMREIAETVQGTSIKGVTTESVAAIELVIPEQTEQEAIVSVLLDMDNELEQCNHKLSKARQIKQGMMQQLLTGKIRLV